ncbi:ADP-ribose pyrophosphatase [Sporomusa carbonis]|uniref:NUDIX hydrolase n=1 Tax=Sporomusa carbonis TaxID=3076075 RepID=UPI003A65776D
MPYTEQNLYEKLIKTTRLFEGKVINLRRDEVMLPSGRTGTREVVEHPGAVAVVPMTKDGKVIMVRQFRHPVQQVILEVPAGKLDPGERPEACALRELAEETGFVANKLRKLTSMYTTPGFSNEIIHLYLAEDLVESNKQPDEDEFINTELYTTEQIRDMIASGEICDAKSLVALYLAGI